MSSEEREQYDLSVEANIRDAEAWKWKKPKRDDDEDEEVRTLGWRNVLDKKTVPESSDPEP